MVVVYCVKITFVAFCLLQNLYQLFWKRCYVGRFRVCIFRNFRDFSSYARNLVFLDDLCASCILFYQTKLKVKIISRTLKKDCFLYKKKNNFVKLDIYRIIWYRLTDLDLFSGWTNVTCCQTRYQKGGRNYQ